MIRKLVYLAAIFIATGASAEAAPPLHESAPPLPIQVHGPTDTARAIYESEQAFEHRSESAGAAAAYAEFLDPTEALDFASGPPVRGVKAIAAMQAKVTGTGKLAWTPREVFASTGDMGVVWGDWIFPAPTLSKPVTGQYVTVWRKTAQGAWKALVNIGTPNP